MHIFLISNSVNSQSVDIPPPPPSCSAAELDAYLVQADRDASEHALPMPISATVLKLNQVLNMTSLKNVRLWVYKKLYF